MTFSANALDVANSRLCMPGESFPQALRRVSNATFPNEPKKADALFARMMDRRFFPNSPAIRNLGDPDMPGLPHACFVLPVEDSIEGIFKTIGHAAKVHQAGGGTGFYFGSLRPRNSPVRSTKGIASGPCSFIDVFDTATSSIKQGSQRRGANMATFSVYHPDFEEFITAKQDLSRWTNFNVSIMLDQAFFEAVEQDWYICHRFPVEWGKISSTPTCDEGQHYPARNILQMIAECAWRTGEPGVLFYDKINAKNPCPDLYSLNATNPCAEQALFDYESCVLGSINLSRYLVNGVLTWQDLSRDIRLYVEALDNTINIARYPIPEIEAATKRTRRIGLGVMGWADLLYALEIPYDSPHALELARVTGYKMKMAAADASMELALLKGPYPASKDGKFRNAARTTVAPTGTLSILADCSSGIEPRFDVRILRQHRLDKVSPDAVTQMTEDSGQDASLPWARYAHQISPDWHVDMQSAWQEAFSDNAISKTINGPKSDTVEDVKQSILRAARSHALGWTYYRDGSRENQVLNVLSDCSGPACSIEDVPRLEAVA